MTYLQGAGTAGNGTADVGVGNQGDHWPGACADVFLYKAETESPGTIAGGQRLGSNWQQRFSVTNSIGFLTDFVARTDKLAFVVNDGYDAVKAAGRCRPIWVATSTRWRPSSSFLARPPWSPSGCGVGQDRQ
jgi:hypothetical protein